MKTNPYQHPQVFDEFVVFSSKGKMTFPGVSHVSVTGGIVEQTEDIAGGNATTTVLSYEPHQVTVRNVVWNAEQFNKITSIVDLMRPLKKQSSAVPVEELECIHPMLELRKVQRLFVFDIENPEYNRIEGWITVVRLKEWWPESKEKTSTRKIDSTTPGGAPAYEEETDITQIPIVPSLEPASLE